MAISSDTMDLKEDIVAAVSLEEAMDADVELPVDQEHADQDVKRVIYEVSAMCLTEDGTPKRICGTHFVLNEGNPELEHVKDVLIMCVNLLEKGKDKVFTDEEAV